MAFWQTKLLIFILFLPLYVSANTMVKVMKSDSEDIKTSIWEKKPVNKAKAVVILLHGLNLNPKKMGDWAQLLTTHDAYVIQLALFGHNGDEKEMRTVTAELWRKQFAKAAELGEVKAKELNVPLYFIGFSLGALVALEWMATADKEHFFKKMVLIAPAVSVPWYSQKLIKTVSKLFGSGLILPSRSPTSYRANKGTSIAAYLALFNLKESLERQHFKHSNTDVLVLIDGHDELIDSKEVRAVISRFSLSHWQIEIVNNRFAYDNYGFRHLMVDEESMGNELWQKLSQMSLKHFSL